MPDSREPIALISDVHANLEALAAVIEDIRGQGIKTIINLGDTVGYGPDPEACIDLVDAACQVILCGNHDYAVLFEADGFNPLARKAVDCHRKILRPDLREDADAETSRRWKWLENLEPMYENGQFEAMHGSPRQPITEYVLPSDPEMDSAKISDIFSAMSKPLAFVGHTHFPGVIEEGNDSFLMLSAFDNAYALTNRRAIVNIGSVGQPRDRNPQSCYVVFDGMHVLYRRVEYDVGKTVDKLLAMPDMHPATGLRLREGR